MKQQPFYREVMQQAHPECSIVYGWHLAGAGAARYGWGAIHPSGMVQWLGRNSLEAVNAIYRRWQEENLDARLASLP